MKNKINHIVGKYLFETLVSMKIAKDQISLNVNEDGFVLNITVEKHISQTQIDLITGKLSKTLQQHADKEAEVNPASIKFIKIRGVSGIVHEGQEADSIFGFASNSKEDFDATIAAIEDRESRDHRKIAKDLELFFVDEMAGKGLPIWLPNGLALKNSIKNYIQQLEAKYDYMPVETPVIGDVSLYKTSGHFYHYRHGMFPLMVNQENEEIILRPMACPHHILVYKHKPRSYRDLPFRIAESVKQYRYEASGALIGLERVRAMELTDGHIFIREDQLENEIEQMYSLITEALKTFKVDVHYIELALHDKNNKEKYHGNSEMWHKAESLLRNFLDKNNIQYKALEGEAAFYGPKIDIQIKTSLGHIITVSTIQLDFLLPEKFDLTYINENKEKVRPIMIHRGVIGTYERFISVLLEQTKGALPFWLSPRQIVIIPVSDNNLEYAKRLNKDLIAHGYRSKVDSRNERLSYKIREAQMGKVYYQLTIGDNEMNAGTLSVRRYGSEEVYEYKTFLDFIKHLEELKIHHK